MAIKPNKTVNEKEITYNVNHWIMLNELRAQAREVMMALQSQSLLPLVHGSIARGDVNKNSDIDIFIPEVQNSFLVETALQKTGVKVNSRFLVQATPSYAVKAHIEINELTTVSFPLIEMRRVEREFYSFGGEITLNQLKASLRVPGVDKRLMFIEPTEKGHKESSIVGKEDYTAKILGVSVDSVRDRVKALLRRDEVGRTGVFVKKELGPDETFEWALKKLSENNPAVRRRMKK